jgi:excisionase family DNA binding protein
MSRSDNEPDSSDVLSRERFLSRREVAQLFGVSVSTVTRWARQGLLKTVRTPGGHYRFPAAETRRAARESGEAELTRLD